MIPRSFRHFGKHITFSSRRSDDLFFAYLSMHFADKLIGVHCTHGLNRSGFIVCRYMIEEMKMPPLEAIAGKNQLISRPSLLHLSKRAI